jgi:alpha-galactosidase
VVHYTLDGSKPTIKSPVYTKPVVITKKSLLSAISVIGHKASAVSTQLIDVVPAVSPLPNVKLSQLQPTKATTGWGNITINTNISGGKITMGGKVYNDGIGVHALSELTYPLRKNYKRFVSAVGIEESHKGGSVAFQVKIDGKVVASSPVIKKGIWHFDVKIPAGSKTITLVTTDAGDGINSDHGNWANPGFITK